MRGHRKDQRLMSKDNRIELRARVPADGELAKKIAAYAKALPIRTTRALLICHLLELGLEAARSPKGEAA
jgi:hypothetical protein